MPSIENKMTMRRSAFALLTALAILAGCSGGAGQRMEATEVGLAMTAPPGWQVDRDNPLLCTKGEGTGLVIAEPLEGRTFGDAVEQLQSVHGGSVITSIPARIGAFDAVQAVIEYPAAGSKAIKTYIHKGDTVIEVSFVTPAGDFAAAEGDIRASLETIEIR